MNRLLQLAAVVDERLNQFGAIDLREEPGSCFIGDSKPYYPKLYLSGKKDKALMSLPGEGTAQIAYRVLRRNIDETGVNGPTYGADIEVQSIEPVAEEPPDDEANETEDLQADLIRLRHFMCGDTPPSIPTVKPGKKKVKGTKKDLSSTLFLRHFDERNRDPEGRFDSGTVARPDDFAIAMMPAAQPKQGPGLGKLAAAAGAGAFANSDKGRKLGGLMVRGAKTLLKRKVPVA